MLRYYTFDEIEKDIRDYFRKDEDVADIAVTVSKETIITKMGTDEFDNLRIKVIKILKLL